MNQAGLAGERAGGVLDYAFGEAGLIPPVRPPSPKWRTVVRQILVGKPRLPHWLKDAESIAGAIARRHSSLKLVLKTKDDPLFLRPWIEHHASIVGFDGLVIADNMSTNEEVFDTYAEYGSKLLVFQYSGFHNHIHAQERMPLFHDALRRSCSYRGILDADERLILTDGRRHSGGPCVVDFLKRHPNSSVFPASWLWSAAGSADYFGINGLTGNSEVPFARNLMWGKPIMRSSLTFPNEVCHNTQLPTTCFEGPIRTELMLLHFANLDPAQRISANIKKLVARGFAKAGQTPEEVAALTAREGEEPNVHYYLSQIRELLANGSIPSYDGIPPSHIHLRPDGEIGFHSPELERDFGDFIHAGDDIARRLLALT